MLPVKGEQFSARTEKTLVACQGMGFFIGPPTGEHCLSLSPSWLGLQNEHFFFGFWRLQPQAAAYQDCLAGTS
jgi:hypothetical protein